jgi:NAD-dependent deacetylase
MRWLKCMSCGERYPVRDVLERFRSKLGVPGCESCQGILKPDVVFFGEMLPERTLEEATIHANRCELMIVVGSSLVVYPAAYMPTYAKEAGAKLVIINNAPTSFDDVADVVIQHSAGLVMERIMEKVKAGL